MERPPGMRRAAPEAPASGEPARDARHFDRWAARYDRSPLQTLLFAPVHEAVLDACAGLGAPLRRVLDVGCGTGRLLTLAAGRWSGARLTGIDRSAGMLREARRRHAGHPRLSFVRGEAARLPLVAESCDAAFSTISFHHWPDQPAGIGAVARVLRPGGLFVLADVDPPWPVLTRPILNRVDHARYQSPRSVRQMLEGAGFTIVMQRRFWGLVRVQLFVARAPSAPGA